MKRVFRLPTLAVAVATALSCATHAASAAPFVAGTSSARSAVNSVEQVRYRGGVAIGIGAGILGAAIIGGALARPYYYGPARYYRPYRPYYGYPRVYYPPPVYYYAPAPTYYIAPPAVYDDAVAYCLRRFRSYDPRTGTYLGYDGYRHPCP